MADVKVTARIEVDKVGEMTKEKLKRGLTKACIFVTNKIKEKISTGQAYTRSAGGYYRGLDPSAPGQPPKLLTGQLRASIAWELVDDTQARIGSNNPYALMLETGTSKMAARPYLRSTLIENGDKVKQLIVGG